MQVGYNINMKKIILAIIIMLLVFIFPLTVIPLHDFVDAESKYQYNFDL